MCKSCNETLLIYASTTETKRASIFGMREVNASHELGAVGRGRVRLVESAHDAREFPSRQLRPGENERSNRDALARPSSIGGSRCKYAGAKPRSISNYLESSPERRCIRRRDILLSKTRNADIARELPLRSNDFGRKSHQNGEGDEPDSAHLPKVVLGTAFNYGFLGPGAEALVNPVTPPA